MTSGVANTIVINDEIDMLPDTLPTEVDDVPTKAPGGVVNICGGAFSKSDQRDTALQKGLKVSLDIYVGTSALGVIKKIEGTAGAYSIFHLECDGINVR